MIEKLQTFLFEIPLFIKKGSLEKKIANQEPLIWDIL